MPVTVAKLSTVIVFLFSIALATWTTALDSPAMSEVDAGMKRALACFVIARSLNAAISLAQGTEVSAGLGANITFSVGQVLDPVNDVVESFSNLMLLASVAFGIQKILLTVGQDVVIKGLLTAVLGGWAAFYFVEKRRARCLDVALILMLMVRFAVPVVVLACDEIYERFIKELLNKSAI